MDKSRPAAPASGIYAALVTPRKGSCCEADAAKLLDYISLVEARGVSGLVLFGSTGEFVHFDGAERARVAGLAIKRSRTPLLVNVSHSDFAGMVSLAESAIAAGAAGLLVMPPYFYRYDGSIVEVFYWAIADLFADQIPIYLYNLPQHTNPIPPDVALRLLSSGRFAGIKDSSGDWAMFQVLSGLRREHEFRLLVGHESIYSRARRSGADGAVSGIAAALPELITALENAILANGQDKIVKLDARLSEYLGWLEKFPATYLIKQTAALRGWIDVPPGLPLSEKQESDIAEFRAWFPSWHASLSEASAGRDPASVIK